MTDVDAPPVRRPRPCVVCRTAHDGATFMAREQMFGSGESFEYFECDSCGTIQIVEVPDDLGRHYPAAYYSFDVAPSGRLRRWLKRRRGAWARGRRWDLLGWLVERRFGRPQFFDWMARAGAGTGARILDVGTGGGQMPVELAAAGWRDVTGIDAFLEADLVLPGGIRILRRTIDEIDGPFDLIMFHHSLEHVPDPGATLEAAAQRLATGGTILVRLPIAGSYAWRTYGTHWFGLDPPRHLVIPTERAMHLLAERAGLVVTDVVYDSLPLSLYRSEQYRQGIALRDPRSWDVDPAASIFTPVDIARFQEQARELNAARDGDAAAFYLRAAGGMGVDDRSDVAAGSSANTIKRG